ncbi:putative cinnamyl alcohol dehydrogenase 1 [Vitis vinifera]|uniref:Putative cinnamyl alcohol dehydrogenase 1 n=1 Tax=Vitis vinifera TaxID=29760 RepID=A0A438JJE8_VITVI|nr:putative cinnamyl alcohol dehydrogenase 1 [Vitis vinifera]
MSVPCWFMVWWTEQFRMTSESADDNCLAWAARDPSGLLSPYKFSRSWARNKLGDSKYPLVPGHEIAGIVKEVGSNVCRFKVGDHVGVGTYVNSCRDCEYCNDGLEVHCARGSVFTLMVLMLMVRSPKEVIPVTLLFMKGVQSKDSMWAQGLLMYCFKIPDNYPLASAAPLLCAGITVYTPMMRHKMNQPGKSLGVIGLGGLGHLAVKFGKAFGLRVTVFSTSISKKEEALNLLGADKFVVSSDEQQMMALSRSLDFIIDTASSDHPFDPYLSLLKTAGVLVLVGSSEVKFSPGSIVMGMRTVSGSATGGTKDIQEMLDFCAAHGIHPEIEVIPIQYANEALERLIKKDVK